jgi:hypothetical protein
MRDSISVGADKANHAFALTSGTNLTVVGFSRSGAGWPIYSGNGNQGNNLTNAVESYCTAYTTTGTTFTNPLFRASAYYTNTSWTAANTGTNFPMPPYDLLDAFRPLGNSPLRKEGLGALPYKPIPTPRAAHRIRTGGQ